MNMQAMLKQAQALQKDMMKIKGEIDNTIFVGESSLVKVEVKGNKEVISVKFNTDSSFSSDDLEILQDMVLVAINDAMKQIDKVTESKMSKFGSIPGLF